MSADVTALEHELAETLHVVLKTRGATYTAIASAPERHTIAELLAIAEPKP